MYRFNPHWHLRIVRGKDGPDNSGINAAALESSKLSKESLDWYKQEYANTAPQRAETQARANAVSDAQLEATKFATKQATDLDSYNKSTFRPLEQKLVGDAQSYDSAARRSDAAQSAVADVDRAFSATQDATARALARSGIAPGSAKSQALMQDAALGATTARAGAATMATRNVEQQAYGRMADAANMGRGIASSQATQQQIATQTGNSSVANSGMANATSQSGAGLMGAGFNTALQGQQISGNLYGQSSSIDAQTRGQDMALMGQLAGGAMMASDEKIKKGRKPAKTASMLEAVNDTPVEQWKYDPAKGGPDDGGRQHTGPMAQKVRATMGEAAAPRGKVIDPITVQGNMMGAIQELTKRVKQIEKEVA